MFAKKIREISREFLGLYIKRGQRVGESELSLCVGEREKGLIGRENENFL